MADAPMRITEFRAENFKRLKVVSIRPDGNMVEITGRNGSGKTSVLDALFVALAGTRHIQREPIRLIQQDCQLTVDVGVGKGDQNIALPQLPEVVSEK